MQEYTQKQINCIKGYAKRIGLTLEEYLSHLNAGEKWCNRCKEWEAQELFKPGEYRCNRSLSGQRFKNPELFRQRTSASAKMRTDQRRLGKKHTPASRLKISQTTRENAVRGEKCHSYKDGKLTERRGQRFSQEYKRWRYNVFSHDHFTCQQCGDKRGGNLIAHHIKPFADYPELRFEISNGITLCESCHDRIHYPSKEESEPQKGALDG